MPGEADVPGLRHLRVRDLNGISAFSSSDAGNVGMGHAEIAISSCNGKALDTVTAVRRQGHDGVIVPTCDSRPQQARTSLSLNASSVDMKGMPSMVR